MRTLEQIRNELGRANVSEVARATGISRATLHRIIAGHGTTYSTLQKINDWLGARQ